MITLCEACALGDHYDCDTNACECAHHCACGQHPTLCICDAIYDERNEG